MSRTPVPSSPWLRPLQVLAGALAIAITALFWMWTQRDVAAAPSAPGLAITSPQPSTPQSGAADAFATLAAVDSSDEAEAAAPADDAPAADANRAVLYGVVRDADGASAKQGYLWCSRDGRTIGSGQTLDRGTFAFAGIPPGDYVLWSRIVDQLPIEHAVVVRAPATRVDLQLPPRWCLRIDAVTPDDEPLSAVKALHPSGRGLFTAAAFAAPLTADLPRSHHPEALVGLGIFRANDSMMERGEPLPKQTVGVLTMPAAAPAHVALLLGTHVVAQQLVEPGQEVLEFRLAVDAVSAGLAHVRMRVVDDKGAPLPGVRVSISGGSSASQSQRLSDEDGRIDLGSLKAGEVMFTAYQGTPMLRSRGLVRELRAGQQVDLGDVVLRECVECEVDFGGSSGSVRFCCLDALPEGCRREELYLSTDSGAPKVSVYPGRYGFWMRSKNGTAITEVDLSSAPTEPVRFDLRPGADLRIDNRVGASVCHVEVRTRSGLVLFQQELNGSRAQVLSLPPGTYEAELVGLDGRTELRTVVLPSTGAVLTVP